MPTNKETHAMKATVIIVTTACGYNASEVGERATAGIEGAAWRDSIDRVDSGSNGRVHIDCDSPETADFVEDILDNDDGVVAYTVTS